MGTVGDLSQTIHLSQAADYIHRIGLSSKGQLNSECIYEVIVYPKIPTKNYKDFCPGSLLEGRADISVIFGWNFGLAMTS